MEKPTFKKLCFMYLQQLTNFPYIEKDFDAITDYQLLCKIVDYLNKVISNNNKQNEVITALYNAFVELKDYVDNYFENLDVQEEINNKLDEMAESGQLADIIAQYLNSSAILGFNDIAEMKVADNLVNGSFTRTYGSNSLGDGIGYFYKVREVLNTDVIDELNLIALSNPNLVAERISSYIEGDTKNPIYYGADPTGTNDSSQAINNCIQANKGSTIEFSIGTYLVNSTINLPYKIDEKVNINGNGATLKNTSDLDRLFYVGFDKGLSTANDVGFPSYIKDLNIDGEESNTTYCIDVIDGYKDLKLYNLRIFRFLNGIRIGETPSSPADVLLTNSLLYGKGSEYNGVGIIANCTDNNFEMCRIYGFRKGFVINGGSVISRCHVLLRWAKQTSSNFDPYERNGTEWNQYYPLTMFAEVKSVCRIFESYCDSTYKFLEITTSNDITFTNNIYFNSRENVNMRLFDFINMAYPMITMNNNTFYCSHYTEGEVIHNDLVFTNYSQIVIKNTILKRNLNLTNPADIILSSTSNYTNSITFNSNTWYIIGAIRNNTGYNSINSLITIGGYLYYIRFNSDANANIDSIIQLNKGTGESRWSIGTVKVNDNNYVCIKNNLTSVPAKSYIKEIYADNLTFHTSIIKTGSNILESSHLLSDYTQLVPTNEIRLNNVLF